MKISYLTQKLDNLHNAYDRLVEWETNNEEIYDLFNRLVRYYNSGNTNRILKNTTAYFQTEIPDEEVEPTRHKKMYVFNREIVDRVVAATKIQCFWRKTQTLRSVNSIHAINKSRAARKIQRWIRNLPFLHRNRFIQ